MDFVVCNETNGVSFYNLSFTMKNILKKVTLSFDLKIKTDKRSKSYDVRVSHINLDVCKLNQVNPLGSYATNYILQRILKDANFRLECPFKKGDFYVRNSPAPDEKWIIVSRFYSDYLYAQWQMAIAFRVKLTEKSTAARAFFIIVHGETVKF